MSEIAVRPDSPPVRWTEEDKKLMQATVARGTTEAEFKLFLYTAAKYELDPLVKEIWCVKFEGKPALIFTGRDGFLAIAHRSGHFAGLKSGSEKREGDMMAWCEVRRDDWAEPYRVEVWLSEYAGGSNPLWKTKPRTMLVKTAESQALRKAFNIHGLYLPEEVDPAERAQPAVIQAVRVVGATSEHTEPEALPAATVEPEIVQAEVHPRGNVKPNLTAFWKAALALGYTQVEVLAHVDGEGLGECSQDDLDDLLDLLRDEKGAAQ